MKSILFFDLKSIYSRPLNGGFALVLLVFGLVGGWAFKMSLGEGVYQNAPYTVGFIIGILSLSIIFIGSLWAFQLLFREWDSRIDAVVFSTPISYKAFGRGRFISFYSVSFLSFCLLGIGFMIGQGLRSGSALQEHFYSWHYLYPILVFGLVNTAVVCAVLFFVAQRFQNKLLLALSGVLLYVLYMVVLLFSNAPFMAQALPQSLWVQELSAYIDPFGLSAYFMESKDLSVSQRNLETVSLLGYWGWNRLIMLSIAMLLLVLGLQRSPVKKTGRTSKSKAFLKEEKDLLHSLGTVKPISPRWDIHSKIGALIAYIKLDLRYLFKSIPLVVVTILLVFYTGMECYAEIDKGIRLPHRLARSGLLAETIISNGHFMMVFVLVYFIYVIYGRACASRFQPIQDTTVFANQKLFGHIISIGVFIAHLLMIVNLEALVFQWAFSYTYVDWELIWVFGYL